MVDTAHITTAEQLLEAGDIGRCELIRGQLHMMTPAGDEHNRIAQEIAGLLRDWVKPRRLGVIYGEGGFLIERGPDTVRAPDAAFIAASRAAPKIKGFTRVIPDIVVEVNSPHDRVDEVSEKVQMWLAAGAKLVWVVDPRTRCVQVCRPDGSSQLLNDQQMLDGGEVLPGFSVSISQIFDDN